MTNFSFESVKRRTLNGATTVRWGVENQATLVLFSILDFDIDAICSVAFSNRQIGQLNRKRKQEYVRKTSTMETTFLGHFRRLCLRLCENLMIIRQNHAINLSIVIVVAYQ